MSVRVLEQAEDLWMRVMHIDFLHEEGGLRPSKYGFYDQYGRCCAQVVNIAAI